VSHSALSAMRYAVRKAVYTVTRVEDIVKCKWIARAYARLAYEEAARKAMRRRAGVTAEVKMVT